MKNKSAYTEFVHSLTDYFTFSMVHRKGSLFLLLLLLLLISGFYFLDFMEEKKQYDYSAYLLEIKRFEQILAEENYTGKQERREKNSKSSFNYIDSTEESNGKLFLFDPNTAEEKTLRALGLSSKVIKIIIRYRLKGGQFKKREDFKKMYGLSEEKYHQLESFITLTPDTTYPRIYKNDNLQSKELKITEQVIDINLANQSDFDSLKGIGPAIASSIISYREKLGGFIEKSQLYEVYGIDSLLFERLANRVEVKYNQVNKININNGFGDDLRHPYLAKNLVKLIVNYRKLHGPFKSVEDLKKLALVNEELYSKLAPYLTIE